MISSFTIDPDEPCLTLSDKPTIISGLLRARSIEDLSCLNSQLNLIGYGHVWSGKEKSPISKKKIEKTTCTSVDTIEKKSNRNDLTIVLHKDQQLVYKWAYVEQEDCYIAPFMFQIPGCLPPSLSFVNKDEEVTIQYILTASVPTVGIHATHTIKAVRSCNSHHQKHPKTRIYWGTTKNKRWRYEVEIPSIIPIQQQQDEDSKEQQEFALSVRVRSSFKSVNQSKVESCLLACQLLESVETKQHPKGLTEPCMMSTHLLMSPAQSWTQPCRLPIAFAPDEQPRPTISTEFIKIRHRLCVTLSFNSTLGHDDKLQLTFPVELVHTMKPSIPPPASLSSSLSSTSMTPSIPASISTTASTTTCRQFSTRSSSSSAATAMTSDEALCYYTDSSSSDDCESRDSAVFLSC